MPESELSGRELDAAVAEIIEPKPTLVPCDNLHDKLSPEGAWVHTHIYDHSDVCEIVPRCFSESVEAAIQVENKIAELKLQGDYVAALWEILGADLSVSFWTKGNIETFWLCIHATAEQRCRAALAAVTAKENQCR